MKISFKNIPKFLEGRKFTGVQLGDGFDWYRDIHLPLKDKIIELLKQYGDDDAFGNWLNYMQFLHSSLLNVVKDNWEEYTYENPSVKDYLLNYSGIPTYELSKAINNITPLINWNNLGIKNAFNKGYFITPGKRISGDNVSQNYVADGLYSHITDKRYLLGRIGDFDENSNEFKDWQKQLNDVGWETYLDNDKYYYIRRLNKKNQLQLNLTNDSLSDNNLSNNGSDRENSQPTTQLIPEGDSNKKYGFDWKAFGQKLHGILTNPELHEAGRLALALHYNDKIYDEVLKGIRPNLRQTYNTYRLVVGDEATKQLYYNRAAQGETKAGRAITSDFDKLIAYLMENKRVGDLLRAQGDLADNQEIRRTSDESNQHQWANIQRATEVANANVASINQANSLRHNLLAQKHSANYSSFDNFWKGLIYNYKQKRAEVDALNKQRLALDVADLRDNDLEYQDAYNEFTEIYNKNYNPLTGTVNKNKEFNDAYKRWQLALRRMLRKVLDFYNNSIYSAKKGTKVTYKKKDDLLYKQAKDAVDHFRKMSKLSSDALNRKQPKIEKLTSHPKGKSRRYLQGGVAPFVVYTPVALGGETVTQTGGSTTKSSKEGETSDFLKELFKSLLSSKGALPSDTNYVFSLARQLLDKLKYFANGEFDTDDLSGDYLRILQQISNIEFYKKEYEDATNNVILKNAGGEIAISSDGRVAVQNVDTGKVSYEKWDDVKDSKKYNPLTNRDLLDLRANVFAFDTNMLNVVSNATSMNEIAKFLHEHFSNLGTNENKIEGYTKLESNMIIQGILVLKEAPSGNYKFSNLTKELQQLAWIALSYISKILPDNMKNLLKVKSDLMGVDPTSIITDLINYKMNNVFNFEIDAVTGKAAKKDGNGTVDDDKMSPAMAFFMGYGERHNFVILDKSLFGLKVKANSMPLIDSSGNNLGQTTLSKIGKSMYGGQLDINSATMGDVKISPYGLNQVIIPDGIIYSTELPIDEAAAARGIIKPDFVYLRKIEEAHSKLKLLGIDNMDNLDDNRVNIINRIYKECGLPLMYDKDANGHVSLNSRYRRFAMLNGMATESAFEGDMNFNDGALEVTDDKTIKQFLNTMREASGLDKYKIEEELYKGIIYIPMRQSTISALAGTGYKGTPVDYAELDKLQQQRDNAIAIGYNNPMVNASIFNNK